MQIVCENLAIGYDHAPLHKNINFSIKKGAYICVIGDNGVGKSTLIKTLLGLMPPLEGHISMQEGLRSIDIGYLPQQTQVQKDFPASVFEVVLSGCLNKVGLRPFYNKVEKNLAKQMLTRLGVLDLSKKSYSELSGGQQQRVLLARALCAAKKILLLDEPTAGLDNTTSAEFYNLIRQLHTEGTTIIMITHTVREPLRDADYFLLLDKKTIQFVTKKVYLEEYMHDGNFDYAGGL